MTAHLLMTPSPATRTWLEGWALRTLTTPGLSPCPHLLADGTETVLAVWVPGAAMCPACAPLAEPDRLERYTCDRCGRHDRTVASVTVAGLTATGQRVTVLAGTCSSCDRDLGVTRPPRSQTPTGGNRAQRRARPGRGGAR